MRGIKGGRTQAGQAVSAVLGIVATLPEAPQTSGSLILRISRKRYVSFDSLVHVYYPPTPWGGLPENSTSVLPDYVKNRNIQISQDLSFSFLGACLRIYLF